MILKKENYKIFLKRYFEIIPYDYLTASALLGIFIFLVGLVISFLARFSMEFVSSVPIYLGSFGIFWTSACLRWGTLHCVDMWNQVRDCFEVSDEKYFETVDTWLERIFNSNRMFILYMLVIVPVCLGVFFYFKSETEVSFRIIPKIFSDIWYIQDSFLYLKISIIILYAIFIFLCLIAASYGFVCNILLTREIGTFPISDVYTAAQKLRIFSTFHLVCSVTWFVGVSLFIIVFRENLMKPLAAYWVIFLTLIGFLMFFVPQVSIRSALEKAKREVLVRLGEEYSGIFKTLLLNKKSKDLGKLATKLEMLERMQIYAESIRTWIYDITTISRLVISSLLPPITFIVFR